MNDTEQMAFFYEIFDATLPRLGPGDDGSTRQALRRLLKAMAKHDSVNLSILDIGCGNGAQTLALAKAINGTIVAVDNHQPYLDELQHRAAAQGVADKIRPYLKDMGDLDLAEDRFDLIWSEGALYHMGFAKGLAACHQLLAPDGGLAVSELCWLRSDVPARCRQFFQQEYPPMTDIDANIAAITACGYDLVNHFVLPESAWMTSYYQPLEERLTQFRQRYSHDPQRILLIDSIQMEIDLYRSYARYYGYIFFLMRPRRQT